MSSSTNNESMQDNGRTFSSHEITSGNHDHGGGRKEEAEGTKNSARASPGEELSTTEAVDGITTKVSSSTGSLGESRQNRPPPPPPPPPPPFGIAPPPALTAAASTALVVAHRDRVAHAACQPARDPPAASTVVGHYSACGHHADGDDNGWVDVRDTSGKETGASTAARYDRSLGESRPPPPPSFSIAPPTALTAAASTAIAVAYRHQEELAAHAARQAAQDAQAARTMEIRGEGCGHNAEGDNIDWVNIRDVSGRGTGVSTAARYLRSLGESRRNRRSPLVSIAPPTALTAAASTAIAVAYRHQQLAAHAARLAARVPLAASTMNMFGHYPGGGHHGEGDGIGWVDIRDASGKGTGVSSATSAARRSYPCSIAAASMAFAANQSFGAPPAASAAATAHHLGGKGTGASTAGRRSYLPYSITTLPMALAANQSFGAPPAASTAVTAHHLGGGHLAGKGSGSSGAVRLSSAAGSSSGSEMDATSSGRGGDGKKHSRTINGDDVSSAKQSLPTSSTDAAGVSAAPPVVGGASTAAGKGTEIKPASLEKAGTKNPKSGSRKLAQKRHPWGGKDWAGHPLTKKLQKFAKENEKEWRMEGGIMMGADGSHFFCSVCGYPGDLTCCDECPRVFHPGCLRVRLDSQQAAAGKITDNMWRCPVCTEGRGN